MANFLYQARVENERANLCQLMSLDENPWGSPYSETKDNTLSPLSASIQNAPKASSNVQENMSYYNPTTHNMVLKVQECQEILLSSIQRVDKAKLVYLKQVKDNNVLKEYLENMKDATAHSIQKN